MAQATAQLVFVPRIGFRPAGTRTLAWQSEPVHTESADAIWMATAVGDPPVVTFQGVVLRVDGPFRLELPL